MRWLISMEWTTVTRDPPDGKVCWAEPYRGLILLEEHPAKYLVGCKQQLAELYNAPFLIGGTYRAHDVHAIFSVMPIDDDLLTEDEIEALTS